MKRTTITVTDAARNFADCVNRAHYQNVTFVLPQEWNSFCSPSYQTTKKSAVAVTWPSGARDIGTKPI